MRNSPPRAAALAVAIATLVAFAGCGWFDLAEKKARHEVKRAADSAARTVEREASKVAQKVSAKASEHLSKAADSLGSRVESAARDAGLEVSGAIKAADVKTALVAATGLDGSHIDVHADATTKTLRLRGDLPRATLRDSVEAIARAHASGYTVRSELAVSPR